MHDEREMDGLSENRGYGSYSTGWAGPLAFRPRSQPELLRSRMPEELEAEFVRNPEMRVPCLLECDISLSMVGAAIAALNGGLLEYCRNVAQDELAAKRADTALLTFGGDVRLAHDFATLSSFNPPTLVANGATPMSNALLRGVELIDGRRKEYRDHGIASFQPWFFLLTDGAPTDMELWPSAVETIRSAQKRGRFQFFAIGVGEQADMKRLAELCVGRPPVRLEGLNFREFFRWVSNSMIQYSHSQPGQSIELAPPGWLRIEKPSMSNDE